VLILFLDRVSRLSRASSMIQMETEELRARIMQHQQKINLEGISDTQEEEEDEEAEQKDTHKQGYCIIV